MTLSLQNLTWHKGVCNVLHYTTVNFKAMVIGWNFNNMYKNAVKVVVLFLGKTMSKTISCALKLKTFNSYINIQRSNITHQRVNFRVVRLIYDVNF
jgi:hypothetical protein